MASRWWEWLAPTIKVAARLIPYHYSWQVSRNTLLAGREPSSVRFKHMVRCAFGALCTIVAFQLCLDQAIGSVALRAQWLIIYIGGTYLIALRSTSCHLSKAVVFKGPLLPAKSRSPDVTAPGCILLSEDELLN